MFDDLITTATSSFQGTTGFAIVDVASLYTDSLAPLFPGVFMAVLLSSINWILAIAVIIACLSIPLLVFKLFWRQNY